MKTLTLDKVSEVMSDKDIELELKQQILQELRDSLEADDEDEANEKEPRVPKQHCIILADPLGHLAGKEFVGWCVQLPEAEPANAIFDKICTTVDIYNTTKKGRKYPVKTLGEALSTIPRKHYKETGVHVVTKEPVWVQVANNELPASTHE
jgi:hypothetical protein